MTEPTTLAQLDARDEAHRTASQTAVNAVFQSALDVLSSEQFAALTDHITTTVSGQYEDKVTAKNNKIAELERQVNVLRNAMTSSDDHVRNAIVDWTGDRGIDASEVNDLLAELDLDPIKQEYTVQVRVMAYQYVDITVEAVDADEAERLVNDGDDNARSAIDRELDTMDWDVEEYEAKNVELA